MWKMRPQAIDRLDRHAKDRAECDLRGQHRRCPGAIIIGGHSTAQIVADGEELDQPVVPDGLGACDHRRKPG
jgi:hypothetical protein